MASAPTERQTVCPTETAVPPLVWFCLNDCSPKVSFAPRINGGLSLIAIYTFPETIMKKALASSFYLKIVSLFSYFKTTIEYAIESFWVSVKLLKNVNESKYFLAIS